MKFLAKINSIFNRMCGIHEEAVVEQNTQVSVNSVIHEHTMTQLNRQTTRITMLEIENEKLKQEKTELEQSVAHHSELSRQRLSAVQQMMETEDTLRKDLRRNKSRVRALSKAIHKWAGRPTKEGAKNLRDFADRTLEKLK